MNWDAIAAIAEAAGALGVILTLLYLTYQTRQNTHALEQTGRMHEASVIRANIDGVMNLQAVLAQDDQLALIWKKGIVDEDLTELEVARFEAYLTMYVFDMEHKLYIGTSVDAGNEVGGENFMERHVEGKIKYLMRSELVQSWWNENATLRFSPEFVTMVNHIANR